MAGDETIPTSELPIETDDDLPPSHRLKAEINSRYMPLAVKCERIAGDPPGVKYPGSSKIGFVRQWLCDAVNVGLSLDEAERVIVGAVTRVSNRLGEGKSLNYFNNPVAEDIARFVADRKMNALRASAPGDKGCGSRGMTDSLPGVVTRLRDENEYLAYAKACQMTGRERLGLEEWRASLVSV
ncbi:hypothetical protein [Acetobacter sicerae]|uniref:hypothetical protein n=1 Tax=Acetobacter sicerae TaxID=85325 RepID=UPI00156B0B69|nr:hypothetical protein [Acetobacter sicerae]NHN93777.1 hypothetical protein [Acetobacter sicerae]